MSTIMLPEEVDLELDKEDSDDISQFHYLEQHSTLVYYEDPTDYAVFELAEMDNSSNYTASLPSTILSSSIS